MTSLECESCVPSGAWLVFQGGRMTSMFPPGCRKTYPSFLQHVPMFPPECPNVSSSMSQEMSQCNMNKYVTPVRDHFTRQGITRHILG